MFYKSYLIIRMDSYILWMHISSHVKFNIQIKNNVPIQTETAMIILD